MIIELNKKFYSREAIEEAINDYNEFLEGEIISDNFEIEINEKESIPFLEKEFCNYVLGLMRNKGFA